MDLSILRLKFRQRRAIQHDCQEYDTCGADHGSYWHESNRDQQELAGLILAEL